MYTEQMNVINDCWLLIRWRRLAESVMQRSSRPSVCRFACPVGILTVTHQGAPAYISVRFQ